MTDKTPTTNPPAEKPSHRLGDIEDKLAEACDLTRIFIMIDGVNCQ
ncbi:hypothetical protein [uncultured Algimonas sp.]|nr:hypothetical protein [uncultured Algimonas sp.]